MFNFKKDKFESGEVEVFTGITMATITDVHAYLDDTFNIVAEEELDGEDTHFNIDDIPEDRRDEAIAAIQKIVGEKFIVQHVTGINTEHTTQTLTISAHTE